MIPGISISPGTYWVTASAENGFHIYMRCADSRTTSFELDFSGVFFYFTVRSHPCTFFICVLLGCLCLKTVLLCSAGLQTERHGPGELQQR